MRNKLNKQEVEAKLHNAVLNGADPYAWAFMQGWIDLEMMKRFLFYYRRKKLTKETEPSLAFIDICNKLNKQEAPFQYLDHMGLLKK